LRGMALLKLIKSCARTQESAESEAFVSSSNAAVLVQVGNRDGALCDAAMPGGCCKQCLLCKLCSSRACRSVESNMHSVGRGAGPLASGLPQASTPMTLCGKVLRWFIQSARFVCLLPKIKGRAALIIMGGYVCMSSGNCCYPAAQYTGQAVFAPSVGLFVRCHLGPTSSWAAPAAVSAGSLLLRNNKGLRPSGWARLQQLGYWRHVGQKHTSCLCNNW
jgi:hypothetical protein